MFLSHYVFNFLVQKCKMVQLKKDVQTKISFLRKNMSAGCFFYKIMMQNLG